MTDEASRYSIPLAIRVDQEFVDAVEALRRRGSPIPAKAVVIREAVMRAAEGHEADVIRDLVEALEAAQNHLSDAPKRVRDKVTAALGKARNLGPGDGR